MILEYEKRMIYRMKVFHHRIFSILLDVENQ
jgi:hypothetical protein